MRLWTLDVPLSASDACSVTGWPDSDRVSAEVRRVHRWRVTLWVGVGLVGAAVGTVLLSQLATAGETKGVEGPHFGGLLILGAVALVVLVVGLSLTIVAGVGLGFARHRVRVEGPRSPSASSQVGGPSSVGSRVLVGDSLVGADRGWWRAAGALALAVSAWFICPLVGAALAIPLALVAKNDLRVAGTEEGDNLATAAIVIAAVQLAIALAAVLLYLGSR